MAFDATLCVHRRMLWDAGMAGLEKLHCGNWACDERPLWAVLVERPKGLYFNGFRDCQCIFKFNTQITNRAVHLRMS